VIGMLTSSARLLRLLSLLQSRPTWTGAELTARLEVTDRTLRRDVDRLRTLGYPVHATSGPAGGYMLGAGASLPPLMLDNQEGLAVAIGLHGAAAEVAGIVEPAQRALAKIEQVLPVRLRKRLDALRSAIVRVPDAGPKVDAAMVDDLAAACAEHQVLRVAYRDRNGTASQRALEPQRLVLMGRHWYLVAWDRGRTDWRTFRVDRFQPPVASGPAFTPRPLPDDDVGAYVTRAVSSAPYRHKARVVVHAPVDEMRARVPPAYGTLEPIDARRCRLLTGASSLDGLAIWLAVTGLAFEVEDPPELGAHLRVLGERLLRAAPPRPRRRSAAARRS
jgi:predicted DNA-binding transcriptional regulator YafY